MRVFELKERTVTETSPYLHLPRGARGGRFTINTTAVPGGAPSTVFSVKNHDDETGVDQEILASVAIVGVGVVRLTCYPTLTAAANLVQQICLNPIFLLTATHGNANAVTYAVGFEPWY